MKLAVWKIKLLTFFTVFLLFSFGRWFDLFNNNHITFEKALYISIYYGILISVICVFVIDLVLANGLLQTKIHLIQSAFYLLIIVTLAGNFIIRMFPFSFFYYALGIAIFSIVFYIAIFVIDINTPKNKNYIFSGIKKLPGKYYRKRPVKTFFELLFRLFPHPEPVALYKIGNPGLSSPVFVTGNFELTIRRVAAALKKMDCWLLICDSRGINIWCATEAGHFGSRNIIEAIQLTKLAEKVNHKKLILPQLAASNVSITQIKEETGFLSSFGPVNIKNIEKYLDHPEDNSFRKVTFNLKERIEVSFCSPIILSVLLLFIFNFLGFSYLAVILPIVYFYNLLHSILFPKRIIKNVLLWSIFFGITAFLINFLIFSYLIRDNLWIINIASAIGISYLIIEFEGWSPLVKFNYGIYKKAEIFVNQQLCTGCKMCINVCLKSVFIITNNKAKGINVKECVFCKACFVQCPVNAIEHSMNHNIPQKNI